MKIGDIVMLKPSIRGFDKFKNSVGVIVACVDQGWRDSAKIWKVQYQDKYAYTFLDDTQVELLS